VDGSGVAVIGVDASRALRTRRTGTERYAYEIIRHLLALPDAPRYAWRLYVDRPPGDAWGAPLPAHAAWRVLPAQRLWTHVALAREVLTHPPTALFVPSHVIPWAWPLRRLPPAVVTIHDLGYRHFPAAHPLRQRLYLTWSTRWSATAATRIIAISQATATDLVEECPQAQGKTRVVYEAAPPLPRPTPDALADVRTRYGLARPYALYVGTLQPRKNLARLVAAYTRLWAAGPVDFDLVLAGGTGWGGDDLRPATHPAADHFHLPGYVPDADLPALLAGAAFFCYPSLYEGFGLPVLEAQSLGVPVMSSYSSSLPEVAGDAAILVDPTDVDAIAHAMLRLSQDDDLRQRLIAAGHANVQRFSWEKAAAETLAVLQEAAAQGR
jgi:glycosyltransferase involved in cell wall biosynthesis